MRVHGVTIWNSMPALLTLCVERAGTLERDELPPLRAALVSGDRIPVGLPDAARALWPNLSFNALGGATEASIWSNVYQVCGCMIFATCRIMRRATCSSAVPVSQRATLESLKRKRRPLSGTL